MKLTTNHRFWLSLALAILATCMLLELRIAWQNERALSEQIDRQHLAEKGKLK